MVWARRAEAPEHLKCRQGCGRYFQSRRTHLCRQCEKEAGIIESLNTQLRRELLEQAAAAEKMAAKAAPAPPPREIIVRNTVFEVVWDGSK